MQFRSNSVTKRKIDFTQMEETDPEGKQQKKQ